MTDRPLRNTAASVRQRLLNLARERGDDFNLLLSRYVHERLLHRLERSPEADRFIVKGATLFALWSAVPHRATKDLDLLGSGAPDIARLEDLFRELCALCGRARPRSAVGACLRRRECGLFRALSLRCGAA